MTPVHHASAEVSEALPLHFSPEEELSKVRAGGDALVTAKTLARVTGRLVEAARYEEAEPLLHEWLVLDDAADGHLLLARLYEDLGRYADAVPHLRWVAEHVDHGQPDPEEHAAAWSRLTYAAMCAGLSEDARAAAIRALHVMPAVALRRAALRPSAGLRADVARVAEAAGDLTAAAHWYRAAVRTSTVRSSVFFEASAGLARVLFHLGRRSAAASLYTRLLGTGGPLESARVMSALGTIARTRGRHDLATGLEARARVQANIWLSEDFPEHPDVAQALDFLAWSIRLDGTAWLADLVTTRSNAIRSRRPPRAGRAIESSF